MNFVVRDHLCAVGMYTPTHHHLRIPVANVQGVGLPLVVAHLLLVSEVNSHDTHVRVHC